MLRKSFYPKIESTLNEWAQKLNRQGFTPNQLTLAGLALHFLAGCIYASGHFFMGGLALVAASLGDMLDGPLARISKRVTPFGGFLDSTIDRYSDFFIFGGVALFYARQQDGLWVLISMGILLGSYATSYTKARAESLIADCSTGVFERTERILTLLAGSFISPLLPLALWTLFIGTHATAIQRILHTQKVLEGQAADNRGPKADSQ